MSEQRQRLVAEIPTELKLLVDADQRTNREVVEAALWTEFGGENRAAVDRRIEEVERRLTNLRSEKNEREREIEEQMQKLEKLQTKREKVADAKAEIVNRAVDQFSHLPESPENPAVENFAEKANMDAADFYQRLTEAWPDA